jgi:DNA polymerase/3'-5' exonuclease PolX
MSTGTKRSWQAALLDANELRAMFDPACYERWEYGGSLRRGRAEVADVEHVIIARHGEVAGDGLFGEPKPVNLLWHRLEELVAAKTVTHHVYPNGTIRWGAKYKGVDFRGHMHELFVAEPDTWGPTLAIRTGPAEFSQRLVTGLLRNGRRNKDGFVWRCQPCTQPGCTGEKGCPKCQGTRLEPVETIPAATEEAYFALCGVAYLPPEKRL